MNAALVVVGLVMLLSTMALVIVLAGMARQLKVLSDALRAFNDEVNPRLTRIREGSTSAQRTMEALDRRRQALADTRTARGARRAPEREAGWEGARGRNAG